MKNPEQAAAYVEEFVTRLVAGVVSLEPRRAFATSATERFRAF